MCYFEFWNYVLTKNLEMDSSFLDFFFKFLKISNLTNRFLKTDETYPIGFSGFRENRLVFKRFFNPWLVASNAVHML
jgi:hypothetical protein